MDLAYVVGTAPIRSKYFGNVSPDLAELTEFHTSTMKSA